MEAITNNKVVRSHNTASKYKQKVTHKHSTIKSSIEKRNIEESKSNISSSLINSESIKLFEPKSRSGNSIINEAIIESKLSGIKVNAANLQIDLHFCVCKSWFNS